MAADPDRVLRRAAEATHGIFTTQQALDAGLTMRQLQRRLACGLFESVYVTTYRVTGSPLTWRGRLLAACRAAGQDALASHRSAAGLWQLPGGREDPAEITCPRWLRGRHPGVLVHESKSLSPVDRADVDGIPVTSVERTLLDLAAVVGDGTVEMAIDSAARRGITTHERLRATVVRLSRPGRRGIRRLRRVLDARGPEVGQTDSEAETLLLRTLRRHGFPRPTLQHVIRTDTVFLARVDAAYPAERIAIEYESYEWHTGRGAHERDNARRNALQALDWAYVGVTWRDLRTGGHQLARDLRRIRALRRR